MPPPVPRKAVILLRVSSTKQRKEGKSLEEQERICREICQRQGYEPIAVSKLTKPSAGAGYDTFVKIKEGISQGAEAVVVADLDRLSREPENLFMIEKLLRSMGVALISADGKLDTSDETGWAAFFFRVMAAASEKRRIRSRAVVSGLAHARTKQFRGGIAPFGYRYTPGNKPMGILGHFEIEPESAKLVKSMFETYVRLKSIRATIKAVNWRKPNGGLRDGASLTSILHNPRYCGRAKYRDLDLSKPEEAIVSPELFEKAQRLLKRGGKRRCKTRVSLEVARNMVATNALLGGFSEKRVFELYAEITQKMTDST